MNIGIYYIDSLKKDNAEIILNQIIKNFYSQNIYIKSINCFKNGNIFIMDNNSTIRIFYAKDWSYIVKNGRHNIIYADDSYSNNIKKECIEPLCNIIPNEPVHYF